MKIKDGTPSAGKHIRIAFNAQEERTDRQRARRRPLVLVASRALPYRGGGRRVV